MPKISVILCTHKPRQDYLDRTLAALSKQSFPKDNWELIVVDNASPEPLQQSQLLSAGESNLSLIQESRPGLTYARLAGWRTAKGDLLVYTDDDNVLAEDYLQQAWDIAEDNPLLGAWSGKLIGEFEIEPSEAIKPHLAMLAIREVKEARWANFPNYTSCPWGAGMCIRPAILEGYSNTFQNSDRLTLGTKAGSLARGEDMDIAYFTCHLGFGIGVFPQLSLTHLMPKERLDTTYLLKLTEETTFANKMIEHLHGFPPPPRPTLPGKIRRQLRGLMQGYPFAWQKQQAEIAGIERALKTIDKCE